METYNTSSQGRTERNPIISSALREPNPPNPPKTMKPGVPLEANSKRLDQIMKDIDSIYINSKNPAGKLTMEKKLQNYNKINGMVEEATQLLNKMEMDVQKMECGQMDQTQNMKMNDWLEMLSNGHLAMRETIYIVEQLQAMLLGLSSETEFVDNVDQEIIYEEQEIFED